MNLEIIETFGEYINNITIVTADILYHLWATYEYSSLH